MRGPHLDKAFDENRRSRARRGVRLAVLGVCVGTVAACAATRYEADILALLSYKADGISGQAAKATRQPADPLADRRFLASAPAAYPQGAPRLASAPERSEGTVGRVGTIAGSDGPEEREAGKQRESAGEAERDWVQLAGRLPDERQMRNLRGGFVDVNGRRLDFGFQLRSNVNGQELVSVLRFNSIINAARRGNLKRADLPAASAALDVAGANGGVTRIQHQIDKSGVNATIFNTATDTAINNSAVMTIRILDINTPQRGRPSGRLIRPMAQEVVQSQIRALAD